MQIRPLRHAKNLKQTKVSFISCYYLLVISVFLNTSYYMNELPLILLLIFSQRGRRRKKKSAPASPPHQTATVSTPPPQQRKEYELPPQPRCPLPKRPSTKDLVGRSFWDEGDFDYNGKATYEPGEFVVKSIKTGGYLMCVRVEDRSDIQKYKLADVRELVMEYDAEH